MAFSNLFVVSSASPGVRVLATARPTGNGMLIETTSVNVQEQQDKANNLLAEVQALIEELRDSSFEITVSNFQDKQKKMDDLVDKISTPSRQDEATSLITQQVEEHELKPFKILVVTLEDFFKIFAVTLKDFARDLRVKQDIEIEMSKYLRLIKDSENETIKDIKVLDTEIDNVLEMLQRALSAKADLETINRKLISSEVETQESINNALETLAKALQGLLMDFITKQTEVITFLKTERDKLNGIVENYKNKDLRLEKDNLQKENLNKALMARIREKDRLIESLQSEVPDLKASLDRVSKEVEKFPEVEKKLKVDYQELLKTHENLKAEYAEEKQSFNKEKKALNIKVKKLEKKNQELKETIAKLEDENRTFEVEIARLKVELEQKVQEILEKEVALIELKTKNDANIRGLRVIISQQDTELKELKSKLVSESKSNFSDVDVSALRSENEALKKEVASLLRQRADMAEFVEKLQTQLNKKITELEKSLSDKEIEVANLTKRLSEVKRPTVVLIDKSMPNDKWGNGELNDADNNMELESANSLNDPLALNRLS